MSCAAIQTGNHFLGAILAQVDCQARSIGAYGYGALADPGSIASTVLLSALTLCIALFGLRLMFGEAPGARDVTGELLKIGIVLTLATSWPAWRTIAYETVLDGPAQIAGIVGLASGLPSGGDGLTSRLDNADQGIVSLTAFGSGRLTGGVVGSTDLGDSTRGIALADQSGFAWGRVAFLVGTIGPIAAVKLGAGFLLALAPLMAGLLLFAGTRDIFFGWLRALGACAVGSLILALTYSVELAMLEGWLYDAQRQRAANVLTPATPTELLVFGLTFAVVAFGLLSLIMRLFFFTSPASISLASRLRVIAKDWQTSPQTLRASVYQTSPEISRAQVISDSLARLIRSEERGGNDSRTRQLGSTAARHDGNKGEVTGQLQSSPALGNSYRRNRRRQSSQTQMRDARP
ncbi:MAG: type IV secretion system protein [Novosphingobium sp.]|uniref:type IV secretion system protein n=1 Tax=Novosphingobium sp. TaxID=1874826 RepID=UPI0032BE36A6